MSARRCLLWLMVAGMILAPAPAWAGEPTGQHVSPEPPAPRLARGVVVVASRDASVDATWQLARQVYAEPALRPRGLDDATARALAGEAPPVGAPPRVRELFTSRASMPSEGEAARRRLASVVSEIGASGALIVFRSPAGQPRARLFVAARGDFAEPVLWPRPDEAGRPSWSSSVAWLASLSGAAKADSDPGQSPSVLASPWFWGALTAVAGVVIVGFVASRDDEPETIHLQGRVSP